MLEEKELTIPSKRIAEDGSERDMSSPYEMGGYYCTIGLSLADNPYQQSDAFNHRRFLDGFRDRRNGTHD